MAHTQWPNVRVFLDVVSKTFGGFRKGHVLQGLLERHKAQQGIEMNGYSCPEMDMRARDVAAARRCMPRRAG